jgi:hypothetical protein
MNPRLPPSSSSSSSARERPLTLALSPLRGARANGWLRAQSVRRVTLAHEVGEGWGEGSDDEDEDEDEDEN